MASWLGRLARAIGLVLASPYLVLREIRRSMTAASATLLIFTIVTLNIIWGYPWTGMFAACISIMVVGWLINRIMAPRLRVSVTLPSSATAGCPFTVRQHLENRRRLPAIDLRISFTKTNSAGTKVRTGGETWLARIGPRARVTERGTICFGSRGIHEIPDLRIETAFPFHVFRATRRFPVDGKIAVTPRLLSADDDPLVKHSLTVASGWVKRQLSGASLEYVGNREYQTGMTVRRWDFASWARLGKPIVREFNTPSSRLLTVIVDTGIAPAASRRDRKQQPEAFERLLSIAATIVTELHHHNVHLNFLLTQSDSIADNLNGASNRSPGSAGDSESILIALAGAEPISPDRADEQIAHFLSGHRSREPLILSTREDVLSNSRLASKPTHIRIDSAHELEGPLHSIRKLQPKKGRASAPKQESVS